MTSTSPPITFQQALRAELPVFAGFIAYFLVAALTAIYQSRPFNPFEFALEFGPTLATLIFLWLCLSSLIQALKDKSDSPLQALPRCFRDQLTSRVAVGLLLIPFILTFIQCFLSLKILLPKFVPYAWDQTIANWDQLIHGGTDPWFLLQPLLGHPAITRTLETVYSALWLLAVLFFPILVIFRVRSRALRLQYFYTYLLSWFLLGNVLAALMLSGGPVYYDVFTGEAARFLPVIDYLRSLGSHELSALAFRDILLEIHNTGKMSQFGGISAMPSMHISMATLFACVAHRLNRAFFIGALAFLVTMLLASVHLGWHYALDGYVAIALTLCLWSVIGWIVRRFAK